MAELLMVLLLFGWPLLIPAVFLCSHGGKMNSRGLFYGLGVLISYGVCFVSPYVWGFLAATIGLIVGAASGSFEQGIETTFAIAVPIRMGITWAILPQAALGVLMSVAALKMLSWRFYTVHRDTTEPGNAPEPRPGRA